MLLDEWLTKQNMSLKRFEHACRNPRTGEPFSYTTLHRIAHCQVCDSYSMAKAISVATNGEVTVAEIADADVIAAALKARKAAPAKPKRAPQPRRSKSAQVQALPTARKPRRKRVAGAPATATRSDGSPEAA